MNPKLLGHEKQSLGNLGYASTQCNQVSVGVGVLTLTCPYGVIGSITDYGVNDAKSGVQSTLCIENASNAQCQPTNPIVKIQLDAAIGQSTYTTQFDRT